MSEHERGRAIDIDTVEPTPEEITAFYQHQTLVYVMRTYDAAMLTLAAQNKDAMEKLQRLHEEGKFFIPPPFPTEE